MRSAQQERSPRATHDLVYSINEDYGLRIIVDTLNV